MRKPHVHADNMKRYAEDAMECDTPWERWERRGGPDNEWRPLTEHPAWDPDRDYRRRRETMLVNRHKVPQPEYNALPRGTHYAVPSVANTNLCVQAVWMGTEADYHRLKERVVHRDTEAAIAHAKALLDWQIN